jgi:preprotein translocase subunit SecD
MTTPGRPRQLTAALLTLGLCAAGAACGDDGGDEAGLLELRPVLAANAPPCPEKAPKNTELVLPKTTDGKEECLELGKPIVDAEDVRSASVGETTTKEPALSIVLGRVGSANLDGFAKSHQGNRLAILADGRLVSAPVLNSPSFAGRIQVTGLSKEKTDDLFRRLNEVIKPG